MSRHKKVRPPKRGRPSRLRTASHPVDLRLDLFMHDTNYRRKSPHKWRYIPDAMINWDGESDLKWLPALAAYDKISIKKMFSRLGVGLDAKGFDIRAAASKFYPYNIDVLGKVTKARRMSVQKVLSWRRRYKAYKKGAMEEPDSPILEAQYRSLQDELAPLDALTSSEVYENCLRTTLARAHKDHEITTETSASTMSSPSSSPKPSMASIQEDVDTATRIVGLSDFGTEDFEGLEEEFGSATEN